MRATFRQRRHEDKDRLQWDWVLYEDNNEPLSRSTESYDNKADAVRCFELTTGTAVQLGGLTASISVGGQTLRNIDIKWETHDA